MATKGRFEILEHTADVGVRASGQRLEECFRQATLGLLEIAGAFRSGDGDDRPIEVRADDLGALLVDWLEEVLYVQDATDSVISSVEVAEVADDRATGSIRVSPRGEEVLEGTAVKAITYHQLSVERTEEGWIATVFFDI